MKKTFKALDGTPFEVELTEHDITPYEVLYHVTLKQSRASIEKYGLLLNQPTNKTFGEPTGMLFFSYPIDGDTSDCFRWYDKTCTLIALDAVKLREDGILFYDDWFGKSDQSSKRNHLCCDVAIPVEYIRKVFQFDENGEEEDTPTVIVKKITEPVTQLFHEDKDEAIGDITNQLELLDVQTQIMEHGLEGYYVIYKSHKIPIEKTGRIANYPDGFYDGSTALLNKLLGIY